MWREIKVLHLEPTDVCQAACPACVRETDQNFDRSKKHHLTIKQILDHVSESDISMLDKMFMCGNYGDPAAGRYTLDIYRYFRKIAPEITLGMNTNGGIQTTHWWQALGEILHRQQDYVVFSVDGLEDTNHLYRRGVCWSKIMENARAYIATGASAHWDMLVYRHNEHQVDACERLARDMGFTWFRAKVSKRPLRDGIEFPLHWSAPMSQRKDIQCHVLREKSIYIDAQGRRAPCCWLGSRQINWIDDIAQVMPTWQSTHPNSTCLSACGTDQTRSNFEAQFRREVAL